jgi:hypothetical protein
MASPDKMALQKQTTPIMDLTVDRTSERFTPQKKENPGRQNRIIKRQRRNGYTQDSMKKPTQWKDTKVNNFNPNSPVIPTPSILAQQTCNMPINKPTNILPFHPAQLPSAAPLQNPLTTPVHFPFRTLQSTTTSANSTTEFLSKTTRTIAKSLPTVPTTTKPFLQRKPLRCPTPSKQKMKNNKSRRTAQRRFKCNRRTAEWKRNIPFEQNLKLTKTRCLTNYGFCANPSSNQLQ